MVKRLCSILLTVVTLFVLCMPLMGIADVMATSQECIQFIKRLEGFAKYPYWDNSQWTVGYGTRCPDDKLEEYQTNGITEEAALELLASMLTDFESDIHRYIKKYELTLTQQQFDALVSFSFNCGAGWTNEPNGYLNTAVREGKLGSHFIYAMCLWSRSGGDFILINRRLLESNIYLNGVIAEANRDIPDNYRCVYLDGNGGVVRYIPHGFDTNDPIKIIYDFKTQPEGYQFNGWYTADGVKVEMLDASVENGTVLYAQWVDEDGAVANLPKGTPINPINVTIKSEVNVRIGPGTYYDTLGKLTAGRVLTVDEIYVNGSRTWGRTTEGWLSLSYTNYEELMKVPEVWPKNGVINASHVNVRSGPGMEFKSMYQLNNGDAVIIQEKTAAAGLDWGKLEDGNWVCLTYVTLEQKEEVEPELPPAPDDKEEIPDEIPPTQPEPEPEPEPAPEPEPPTEAPSEAPTEPEPTEPPPTPGDVNGDDVVNKDDAIYLLRHVLFPEKYPLNADGDIDKDNDTDKDDAIYLLRHVLFPEKYPLEKQEEI